MNVIYDKRQGRLSYTENRMMKETLAFFFKIERSGIMKNVSDFLDVKFLMTE